MRGEGREKKEEGDDRENVEERQKGEERSNGKEIEWRGERKRQKKRQMDKHPRDEEINIEGGRETFKF